MPIGAQYPAPGAAPLPPIMADLDMCAWIPYNVPDLNRRICWFAHAGVGLMEKPPGSNRGPTIDRINREAGVPEKLINSGKGYWCASWVRWRWRLAGADYPRSGAGSCDEWMKWAKKNGHWSTEPGYGFAVVYGVPGDANHIGIITRLEPALFSVEGNTTPGGKFNRDGIAVDWKPTDTSRVLGFIRPVARTK